VSDFHWIEFARWNLDWIQDQIKRADEKANIHLAVYLALTGVFVAHLATLGAFIVGGSYLSNLWWPIFVAGFVLGAVCIICILLFVQFYRNFHLVLKPRIDYGHLVGEKYCSLIFWGGISKLKYEGFQTQYPPEEKVLSDDLKKQLYINSVIANEKYKHLEKATKYFPWTILATAIFVVLVYCLKGI
jgi:nitrogen regulatory protein PII-like uncharacterized protein